MCVSRTHPLYIYRHSDVQLCLKSRNARLFIPSVIAFAFSCLWPIKCVTLSLEHSLPQYL
jgi:hypothetical protein